MALNFFSDLGAIALTVQDDAVFVLRETSFMQNLVLKFGDRTGGNTRTGYQYNQGTAQAIAESDDLASHSFVPAADQVLTPAEIGLQFFVSDVRAESDAPENIMTDASRERWAYCKLYGVVEQLNQKSGVAYAELESEVKKAIELAPREGFCWNTLGVAQYRAGDWQAAIAALEKSVELRRGGDSFDWFYLAMARWQLGDKQDAHKWYEQAVDWAQKNAIVSEELQRFRAESAALLGIKNE
jgi:tetratricopeptide (TPR) repeat protein